MKDERLQIFVVAAVLAGAGLSVLTQNGTLFWAPLSVALCYLIVYALGVNEDWAFATLFAAFGVALGTIVRDSFAERYEALAALAVLAILPLSMILKLIVRIARAAVKKLT